MNLVGSLTEDIPIASNILVGRAVGMSDKREVLAKGKTWWIISLFTGHALMAILYFIRKPLMLLYPNISLTSQKLAMEIITISSVLSIFTQISNTCYIGIFHGSGDGRSAIIIDTFSRIFISIVLGYLGAFVWKLPTIYVYVLMSSNMIFKGVVATIEIFSGRYIKNITN